MKMEIDDDLLFALMRHPDKFPEMCGSQEDVRRQVEFCVYEHVKKLNKLGKLPEGGCRYLRNYQIENKDFIAARLPDRIEEETND